MCFALVDHTRQPQSLCAERTDADAGVANTIVITTNYAIIGMAFLAATTSALTSRR